MQSPLEIISNYGVSTSSYIRAIHEFNDINRPIVLNKHQYEQGIADIVGAEEVPQFSNEKEARLYFLYTVQETIRAFHGNDIPDMVDVWKEVTQRMEKLIEESPWAIKEFRSDDTIEYTVIATNGVQKKRKGAKKDEAEALYAELNDGTNARVTIINALIDEVGMSKPGATTYFHNLKKKYGFSGPKTETILKKPKKPQPAAAPTPKKEKGPSKSQIAKDIYIAMKGQPKSDIINEIINKAGTSKAGANTYYCSCRAEFGD